MKLRFHPFGVGVIVISFSGLTLVGLYAHIQRSRDRADSQREALQIQSSMVIDEHLTVVDQPRTVNLCGRIYRAGQILVDGIDVVQRVADLATQAKLKGGSPGLGTSLSAAVCQNMSSGAQVSNESSIPNLNVPNPQSYADFELARGQTVYVVTAGSESVIVDPAGNAIYIRSGFDGSLIGPVGSLREE